MAPNMFQVLSCESATHVLTPSSVRRRRKTLCHCCGGAASYTPGWQVKSLYNNIPGRMRRDLCWQFANVVEKSTILQIEVPLIGGDLCPII